MRQLVIILILLGSSLTSSAQPWFEKSSFGGEARHRATAFSIGNEGYIGLGHINSAVDVEYEDFWKYDPASDSWSQIANLPQGRCYHAAAFVIGNKAYVGSGRLENGTYSKKFFCYDPITNIWSPIADLPGLERRGAVGFSINGKGYVGTGQTTSGYSSDFYEYNPTNNTWIIRANFPGTARTSAVGFSIGNYGYLGTGNTTIGSSNDFYQYNPVSNTWTNKAAVGPTTRQEAVGFAVNGFGYIGTGDDFSSGNNYSDMWKYDPALNSWIQIADFAGTARRYLVGFVIGTRAYVGTGTNGTNFRDFWMFDQDLSVTLKKLGQVEVVSYPNPACEKFTVKLNDLPENIDPTEISIELTSSLGIKIIKKHFESNSIAIETKDLQNGSYVYRIIYKNAPFKTGRLTVINQ